MGYACPVCGDPQADARHLANHLAFTAILGDDAHEIWLDDHVPGWGERGEDDLAEELTDRLETSEFPQVFEDTVGASEDPLEERSGALFEEHLPEAERAGGVTATEGIDSETAAILERAREMTRTMMDDPDRAGDASGDDDDESGDGDNNV